jgi:hypothetical protein
MAFERNWLLVPSRLLTADGGIDGSIQVSTTSGLKVKQQIALSAVGEPTIRLEIKRVLSQTTFLVGDIGQPIYHRRDVSSYTLVKTSAIQAEEQTRPNIPQIDHERAVYEEEPTVAKRVVMVDRWGDIYGPNNPLPIQPGQSSMATTPDIQNILAAVANTEYSFTVPAGTRQYRFKVRGNAKIQYCFISGNSNTVFMTVDPGNSEGETDILLPADKTIYFRVTKDNTKIEVLTWI